MKKVNEKCKPGVCPYNPYYEGAWGLSPESWEAARQNHEENHLIV